MDTKTSILIVDDDPKLRKTLSDILRARGYAPTAVATGEAALDRVEEEVPAVALIDLKLEDMSGLELMEKIKECCPGTECIVLTGYASQESAIEAVNLGAYSYVQKPYDMEQLLVTVRRAVEKRESEERYRISIESAPYGIMVHVHEQNERILIFNPQLERITGYSKEEIPDVQTWLEKIYPDKEYRRAVIEARKTITPEEHPRIREAVITRKDGEKRICQFVSILLPSGIRTVFINDITERKRAEERIQRLLDQQTAANQLALALGETRDLDKIYHTIYEHIRALMDAGAFIVSFYDKGENLIRAGYVVVEGTVLDAASFPPIPLEEEECGTQSQVIRTGQPFYAPDWRKAVERTRTKYRIEDNGTVSEGLPPPERREAFTNSALYVPMKIEGETIGVMQVQSHQLDAYSQEDMDLLSTLANVAAIAIQNARLYEETRSRAERLAVVNRISRAVGATLNLDELMETVYREVTSVLQADAFFIALYDEGANELDYRLRVDEGIREPRERRPLGTGLTSLVVSEKKPLLVRDFEKEKDRLPEVSLWGTMKAPTSWLGVPMLIGERLVGVICVQAYHPRAYGEEEELLLSTIADQVAVAIENARLFEQAQQEIAERKRAEEALRQRTAQLEALRQVGLELTAQLDLDALLRSIVSQAVELVEGASGGFDLYQPDRDVLEWAAAVGSNMAPIGTVLHRGEGVSGKVLETGEPLIVDDYQHWEGRAPAWEGYPITGIVGVPVRWGGEFLGSLIVHADPPRTFSPADAELLSLFATQAAIAIQNARLYEETRSRAERLAVVNRISRAVGATLNLDELMETVYREVTSVLQADAFFIALYDEEANELDFRIQVDQGVQEPPGRQALETGLTSLVVTEKNPLLIRDLEQEQHRLPSPELWGTMKPPASWLGVPMLIGEQLIGVICVQTYRPRAYGEEEELLLSTIADQVAVAIENARLFEQAQQEIAERKRAEEKLQQSLEQLRKTFEGTIEVLVSTIGIRDPYTATHQRRVAQLACAIADEMGLSEERIQGIRMASLIHDLGKINIPAEILSKPGTLSDLEHGMIRMHVQAGYDVLKRFDFPWPLAEIVLQHHERMDGSGYPQGLSDDEIMLEARILAVADVVSAMASHRPYRSALGVDRALEEISQNKGVLYDAEVADVCLKLFAEKGFEFD